MSKTIRKPVAFLIKPTHHLTDLSNLVIATHAPIIIEVSGHLKTNKNAKCLLKTALDIHNKFLKNENKHECSNTSSSTNINPFSTIVSLLYSLKIFSGGMEVEHWLKMG